MVATNYHQGGILGWDDYGFIYSFVGVDCGLTSRLAVSTNSFFTDHVVCVFVAV